MRKCCRHGSHLLRNMLCVTKIPVILSVSGSVLQLKKLWQYESPQLYKSLFIWSLSFRPYTVLILPEFLQNRLPVSCSQGKRLTFSAGLQLCYLRYVRNISFHPVRLHGFLNVLPERHQGWSSFLPQSIFSVSETRPQRQQIYLQVSKVTGAAL